MAEIGKPERSEPWQVPVPSRETKPERTPVPERTPQQDPVPA